MSAKNREGNDKDNKQKLNNQTYKNLNKPEANKNKDHQVKDYSNGGNHANEHIKNRAQNNKSSSRSKEEALTGEKKINWFLIPLILIITVLPLIVKLKTYDPKLMQFSWFPNNTEQPDFFLYYKQWIFIGLSIIMVILLIVRAYLKGKSIRFSPIFIPLSVYALLVILSTVFSKYTAISLRGSLEQFESVFAILGYCLVVYYAFLFINTEKDVKNIFGFFTMGALILAAIGLTQFFGHDFFATQLGTKLITSMDNQTGLLFNFGGNRVYSTLYNPNYVGVYAALVAPIFLILLLFSKKIINSLLYLILIIGLGICEIGSQSLGGLAGIAVASFAIIIFMWRYLLKRFYVTIPILLILFAAIFFINKQSDNILLKRVLGQYPIVKTEKNLTDINTGNDKVTISYKGNQLNIVMLVDTAIEFVLTDENNNNINYTFDEPTGRYVIQDERFPGFTFGPTQIGDYLSFVVNIDGINWPFTNQTGDGTYYLYNRYGKFDKIVNAPSSVFTGYESIASGRGYLWSRTIPLIKDNIILGSGPDTFIIAFPQQDYLGLYNYGYQDVIVTKPHNLYLQIAIQTGLLSLIAFLLFYLMYAITCIRLYIKGRYHSYYAKVGIAIFIGSLSYMVANVANDSSITTAPVFWVLIGIGIAVNYKAKPFILAEVAEIKDKKLEKKALKQELMNTKKEENNQ